MPRKPSVVRDAMTARARVDNSSNYEFPSIGVREPTSTDLADYTIVVKAVENGWWQAQLTELPGVTTTHRTWSGLRQYLKDALILYQLKKVELRP